MRVLKKKEKLERRPIDRTETSPTLGLTKAEVDARREAGWDNRPVSSPTGSIGEIIAKNVFTYFNMIFFVIAAALLLVGSFNNLAFLVIIFANLMIGIVQEINSKRTLDSLTLLNERSATVIRDGVRMSVATHSLVIDDIVVLSAGNQICADAVVVSGFAEVNESPVTGESDEISKTVGSRLISGSYVVSGECLARLEAVGEDSFVSKMTLDAKKKRKHKSHGMMLSLKRLIQIIGILIIPLGAALILRHHLTLDMSFKDNIEQTAAAVIGMIPEGLYLLVNVTLAVSVAKLARKDTLVHDLGCIEMLARVDTLCLDKTGTITDDTMTVDSVIPFGAQEDVSMLRDFVLNMPCDNITMNALREYFSDGKPCRRADSVSPFSSVDKMSSAVFSDGVGYRLGAPEFVMRERYREIRGTVENYLIAGYRVLLFASYDAYESLDPQGVSIKPVALVLLKNSVRPDSAETFAYFARQGVDIKVISGDNGRTASAAARQAGIEGADRMIDLTGMSDDEVAAAAVRYTVFGRVSPTQKQIIVKALKESGRTVAMTGDGVNDIPALREADCSIAMASGSDVACQVSNLVLLKSRFSSLPSVVSEGRQVINNIERSASLFLVKNIFSFLMSLLSIFAVFAYPLKPVQISIVSGLTIGIPSFVLALEKNENKVSGRFLKNVIYSALPAGLTDVAIVLGVVMFSLAFDIDSAVSSSICTMLMGIVGFAMIIRLCRPFNKVRYALVFAMAILFVGALIVMPEFFEIVCPDFGGWLVFAVFVLLIPTVISAVDRALAFTLNVSSKISAKFQKRT